VAHRTANQANQIPHYCDPNRQPKQKYAQRNDDEVIVNVKVETERAEKQERAGDEGSYYHKSEVGFHLRISDRLIYTPFYTCCR
jgi:hypothetical protein